MVKTTTTTAIDMEEDDTEDSAAAQDAGDVLIASPQSAAPVAAPGAAQVAMPAAYAGPDPVLRNPELARFVPPGFVGTRYQLPPANQEALHEYVTAKADDEARTQNYINDIQRSAKVEDAYKAVNSARRFMATRKLGNEYSAGLAAGLPHAQAMASAMYNNAVDLFADHPERMPQAFKQMGAATAPAPPLGQVTVLRDPETGEVIGRGVRNSEGRIHVINTHATVDPVATQQAKFLDRDVVDARKALSKLETDYPAWRSDPDQKQQHDTLQAGIDDKQRTILAIKKGGVTVIAAPQAGAAPVTQSGAKPPTAFNKVTGERAILINGKWERLPKP